MAPFRPRPAQNGVGAKMQYNRFPRCPCLKTPAAVAGDGHFFDPGRSESQGSFFFCFAEDGSYVFYPAFRNSLAAVVDGQKAGVFVAGSLGIETADFEKAQELWQRYGAAPRR